MKLNSVLLVFVIALFALSGCSKKPSGKYVAAGGELIELKSDGTFYARDNAGGVAGTYAVEGNQITMKLDSGRAVRATLEQGKLVTDDGRTFYEATGGRQTTSGSIPVTPESKKCEDNLKQIGLAFRQWALDNGDENPFNVSTNRGGTLELCSRDANGFDRNAHLHLVVMAKELYTPRVLVCPADSVKHAALDFRNVGSHNVSYQIRSGTNVKDTYPDEVISRCPIHGHVGYCDGRVVTGKKQ